MITDLVDESLREDHGDHARTQLERESSKQSIQRFQAMASDHTASGDPETADGDDVAGRRTATVIIDGPIGEVEPTGKPFEVTGVAIYRMEDGRAADGRYSWDEVHEFSSGGAP